MKELKIKRAVYCLIAVAAIKVVTVLYIMLASVPNFGGVEALLNSNMLVQGMLNFSFVFGVAQVALTYFIISDLKKDQAWAWVTALCFFVFSAPSFALPACIIGFISLIDADVRAEFIKQLDIKI